MGRTSTIDGYPRRCREAARPARVCGPLSAASVLVLTAVLVAVLLGLPASAVVVAAFVTALAAGLIFRRTTGSLLVGAGLFVARPYLPGEAVRLYVPRLRRVVVAEIVRVGPANTTLRHNAQLLVVPNSVMVRRPPETSVQA